MGRGEKPFSPLQNMILSLYLNLIRIVGQLIGMTITSVRGVVEVS